MKEEDFDSHESSEDEDQKEKLVPVGEAIRYRKRAQVAEQQAEVIEQELKTSKEQSRELQEQIDELGLEKEITAELIFAGVIDLEAAVMMAKSRMKEHEDVKSAIKQLRTEKAYLFSEQAEQSTSTKTAGVKNKNTTARSVLEASAKKAAVSGNRADVQEYLKVRRQFLK
jgi:hypothetical protein